MTSFKLYNLILLSLLSILAAALAYSSFSTQPYVGDLTRVGGFPEKLYGWNKAQESFAKPLFKEARSWRDYDRPYQVVVIGDSFSKDKKHGWQNFLANNTGLSVITFHVDRFKMTDLLKQPMFKQSPPVAVIYESVERMVIPRLARDKDATYQVSRPPNRTPEVSLQPLNIATHEQYRNTQASFMERINVTSDLISKAFLRDMLGLKLFKSISLELQQSYFSTERGNQLLFLKSHLSKESLSLQRLKEAASSSQKMKKGIEANGYSKFILLVFPNKISVYRDYLTDKSIKVTSFFDYQHLFSQSTLMPLFSSLQHAVAAGIEDVFLSNDTHTSSKGYKIAALNVQQFLQSAGVLQQESSQ